MKRVVGLLGLMLVTPLGAVEVDDNKIILTNEEVAACLTGGGCLVVPRAVLLDEIERQARRAYEAGKRECPNRI